MSTNQNFHSVITNNHRLLVGIYSPEHVNYNLNMYWYAQDDFAVAKAASDSRRHTRKKPRQITRRHREKLHLAAKVDRSIFIRVAPYLIPPERRRAEFSLKERVSSILRRVCHFSARIRSDKSHTREREVDNGRRRTKKLHSRRRVGVHQVALFGERLNSPISGYEISPFVSTSLLPISKSRKYWNDAFRA